jgi:putative ABC transport system permease protein
MTPPRTTFWARLHLLAVRTLAPSLWRRQGEHIRATVAELHSTAGRNGRTSAYHLVRNEVGALVRQAAADTVHLIGSGLVADARYATRLLLKKPLTTGVMMLTMALGIAVNVTVFRAVNQMLIQPLPFEQPQQLAMLWDYDLERGRDVFGASTPASFDTWRTSGQDLAAFAASRNGTLTLTALERPESPLTAFVTPNLYDLLGVAPIRGRSFTAEDSEPGAAPVAILSYELWQQLGPDTNVVGTQIELDGRATSVVGVMPAGFRFPLSNNPPRIWAPLQVEDWSDREARRLFVFARLDAGVSFKAFSAAMESVSATMAATFPDSHGGRGVRIDRLQEWAFQGGRAPVLLLMGAVGFVLLIACVNIANLQVARTLGRREELQLRIALGAGRGRIVRQLLVEASLIAGVGGGLGLLATFWTTPLIDGFMPTWASNPFYRTEVINGSVLMFTLLTVCSTAFAFGLIPAFAILRSTRRDGGGPLRSTEDRRGRRLRRGLTIAEVAISLILLTGTGLTVRSLVSLRALDPGLNVQDLTVMRTGVRGEKYEDPAVRAGHFRQVVEGLEALPGVVSATAASRLPPSGAGPSQPFEIVGGPATDPGREPRMGVYTVTAGYFDTLGIKVLSGTPFSRTEVAAGTPVVVINATARQRFWPGTDPVGEIVRFRNDEPRRIVAVVGDVRSFGVPPVATPVVFIPNADTPASTMSLAIRSRPGVDVSVDAMQKVILDLEPRSPIYNIDSMAARIEQANNGIAATAGLLAGFAAMAVLLVAIGVYAIMSQTVGERFREFGIRMALGAPTTGVMRLVFADAVRIAAWGVAIGIVGSLALGRALSSLLFEVGPYDPITLGVVLAGTFGLIVAASYLPGRRATRANPADTLRA